MTNVAPMHNIQVRTLADKAMLVRLARRRMRVSLRDKDLERTVRAQANDDSLTVTKHLFRDPDSPVRKLMQSYDELYRMHVERTLPWIDRGPRLLPSAQFFDYMEVMRTAIEDVTRRIPPIISDWEAHVARDIAKRGGRASRDDYPDRYHVENMFSVDLQTFPLPDTGDFRVEVDEATKAALEGALADAEAAARSDIIRRMLEPVERAIEKLAVPIGEKGGIFRDSLIHNLFEGVYQAKRLNISDDPALIRTIEEVEARLNTYMNKDALRQNQTHREHARKELNDIMSQLGQL
jgi:hypothetical protein